MSNDTLEITLADLYVYGDVEVSDNSGMTAVKLTVRETGYSITTLGEDLDLAVERAWDALMDYRDDLVIARDLGNLSPTEVAALTEQPAPATAGEPITLSEGNALVFAFVIPVGRA